MTAHSSGAARKAQDGASFQAYCFLRIIFTIAPILFGLDKLFGLVVGWQQYLYCPLASLNAYSQELIIAIGAIEILAGIGVAFKPSIFGWFIAAWILLVMVNAYLLGNGCEILVRDFGLCITAIALTRMGKSYND